MKKFPIFLVALIAFFICHNASAVTADCIPDPDSSIRPASHCTIHLLRSLFAKEIRAEKTRLRTSFDAVALYSVLKTFVMPHDKFLYVSCVLGVSIGNGFSRGVISGLVTTTEDQTLMRGVIGDALGYVKPGFTLCKESLHAPEIAASEARIHVATINALANGEDKKLQAFSVLPPPARPYQANLREMVQQEYNFLGTESESAINNMYRLLLQVGSERSLGSIIAPIDNILPLLHFSCRFPQYEPRLQARIIDSFKEWEKVGRTWSSEIISRFTEYSGSNLAVPYLTAEEQRKAQEQEWRAQAARAREESQRNEEDRKRRFKPNGYPKVVQRFRVDLSTIYSAVDMQSWMCSNGLSEESDSMMIVEKVGGLFQREEMGEEEFVKRTIAALLGRGKKNIRAFEGYRWASLKGGAIAREAFGRIEGGFIFKEADMAEGSFMLNAEQHIQDLNSMLKDAGVPEPVVAMGASPAIVVAEEMAGDQEEALLQKAIDERWNPTQLSEALEERKRIQKLKAVFLAAKRA